MAETKTTIPVEIKMGNAGTNDANLPAFKEGSIIFTKDTKKIYIDPVGETERIEIGENKQDKFADITNPGICKVTMSNPGQTYFCNYASDSGIYFDSSIRLLQGKGIKNDDDLINKKYVDDETAKKQDKFADLDYVWDGDSFEYLSLNLKSAAKDTSPTSGVISIVSDLRLNTETGTRVYLTVGAITVDPIDNGRYSSGLSNTFLRFKDREASATLPSMLITPTAHNGTTPAYLTFASPAQNTAVGNANVRLTGIAAPTADNDATNKKYVDTIETKITNSKVGQKLEGGEIFNDYEHNRTFGEGTSARGLNTQAGTLARKIVANGITKSADSDIMYLITVSGLVNSDELCTDAWVATDSYVEGTSDLVTVDCSTHLSNAFYISKIEENSETNTTVITIKKVDDRVVPILTMDDITGANREEDWIYVPGKLNGEISPQFTSAFAGGKNSVATGFAAMSFGRDNVSAGNYSATLGRGNKASYGGLAAGVYNEAGNYGTALGNSNKALGDNSVATGVGTYARAASSRAGGRYSRAESEYSVAEGLHVVTDASTPAQVVFGRYNRAHNNSLFIIGNGTSDTQRSNAFEIRQNGSVWVLDGTERLATISDVNTKPGKISPNNGTLLSIYKGYTTASGNYSLASGYSKATAPYSTALGWGTASEEYAFSTGYDTMSEGFASASFGYKTKADSHSQFVVGRNNESVSNALFIVGNGSSDNSRSNAFEVYNDGHAEVQTQGTTDNSVVNKKYINDNILDYISLSYAAGPSGNQETTSITADNSSTITLLNKDGIGIGISKGALAHIGPGNATLIGFNIDNSPIASEKYVSNSIATQVSSVYKAKGSITNLTALPTPDKAHEGYVYNIESAFTTTANFVEGAGKVYPAGTNVVCINTTGTTYKWDVLAGMVDLSNYATKTDLSGKQDKFATVTTENTIQTVKIGDDLSIVTSPNLGYSQISSTKILSLSSGNSTTSYIQLGKTKLGNNHDFDATQGYLRVRDNPLADDFAVNKKYVDDIKTELLNAITHPYTYDETTKELTLIL